MLNQFLWLLCILVPHLAYAADPEFSLEKDSLLITVHGVNLTEDMSTLSSKNDEVLLLLYSFDDTLKLKEPVLAEYFVLDSTNRKKTITLATPDTSVDALLVLVELDTERTPDLAEKLIRKNFRAIMSCLDKRDLIALQQYLGDDDIIGIKVIPSNDLFAGTTFTFQGRYKLDKFLYRIEIKK